MFIQVLLMISAAMVSMVMMMDMTMRVMMRAKVWAATKRKEH
ncbi:MAG: hypothetical protein MAG431_00199 [Chloroflexi bacterium]|nr:hypothetical protein [Chloroflexota bacterium]